jgi:hypothetical protein
VDWRGAGGKSRLALCLSCPRAVIRGAAALAAYARQRDDPDLAVWTAEIRLRAGIRIGELVRELKVSEQAAGGRHDTAVAPTTTQAVEDAGLNVRTAQRYEELAGLRDEQGQAAGRAANRSNLFSAVRRGFQSKGHHRRWRAGTSRQRCREVKSRRRCRYCCRPLAGSGGC